ncbi:hypothetical protein TRAPUB_9137 [Trametes pubescens]|uniref:Uncharacterized protein n=1 Tax=Trametes pubescens TaxID=154538 RepID=A0A1M2W335_TRAPU|nr:hypothetical protein TRAPUB_9137 [Trametes pubescens]
MSAEVTMSSTGGGIADGVPASPAYPRTRSRTRSQPALKRKGSDIIRAKPSKPAKIARAGPSLNATPSVDTSPEAAAESPVDAPAAATARTMWPPEVPRSMLFTFRVGPPAFQMYDGAKRTSALDVSPSSDTSQFEASGPEPMFDNSWRISFVESAHSSQRRTTIAPATEQTRIHDSPRGFVTSAHVSAMPPSAPSCSTQTSPNIGPVLHSVRRDGRVHDENVFPMIRGLELVRVEVPKHTDDDMFPRRRPPPTPLSPSKSLTQNGQRDLHSFTSSRSVFPSPIPLVASDGRLASVAEGPFPTYGPVSSSDLPLMSPEASSGVNSGRPPSVFGPCPAFFPGTTPVQPQQPSPPMAPLSMTPRDALSRQRAKTQLGSRTN